MEGGNESIASSKRAVSAEWTVKQTTGGCQDGCSGRDFQKV